MCIPLYTVYRIRNWHYGYLTFIRKSMSQDNEYIS